MVYLRARIRWGTCSNERESSYSLYKVRERTWFNLQIWTHSKPYRRARMGRWSDLSPQNLLIIIKVRQLRRGLVVILFTLHFQGHKFVHVAVGRANQVANRWNMHNGTLIYQHHLSTNPSMQSTEFFCSCLENFVIVSVISSSLSFCQEGLSVLLSKLLITHTRWGNDIMSTRYCMRVFHGRVNVTMTNLAELNEFCVLMHRWI